MTTPLLYVIVAALAVTVTLLEIVKTFGRDTPKALRRLHAWLLLGLNVIVALIVYTIARAVFSGGDSPGTAVFVGLAYPLLLRSRFTYFRAVGAQEDERVATLSLKLDEAYTHLQDLLWRPVDEALADRRVTQAEKLAGLHTADELVRIIEHHLEARRIEAQVTADRARLDDLRQIADEKDRRYRLALLLIDINPSRAGQMLRRRR